MEEQLISVATAKLAKEKGFNINTVNSYCYFQNTRKYELINHTENKCIFAPTQSLLQKWLRDKHNIHIDISVASAGDGEEKIKWYYSYVTGIHDCLSDEAFSCTCNDEFNSYEEALEEALKVTLDCIF